MANWAVTNVQDVRRDGHRVTFTRVVYSERPGGWRTYRGCWAFEGVVTEQSPSGLLRVEASPVSMLAGPRAVAWRGGGRPDNLHCVIRAVYPEAEVALVAHYRADEALRGLPDPASPVTLSDYSGPLLFDEGL